MVGGFAFEVSEGDFVEPSGLAFNCSTAVGVVEPIGDHADRWVGGLPSDSGLKLLSDDGERAETCGGTWRSSEGEIG